VLTELTLQGGDTESSPRKFAAADLFSFFDANGLTDDLFPTGYVIGHAIFEFYFENERKPLLVHVCPPNKLRLSRRCDARPVHHWLSHFRLKHVATWAVAKGGRV
jgi:hypothetical protein